MNKGLSQLDAKMYFDKNFFLEELKRIIRETRLSKYDVAKYFDISYAKLNDMSKEGFASMKTVGKLENKGFRFLFIEKR